MAKPWTPSQTNRCTLRYVTAETETMTMTIIKAKWVTYVGRTAASLCAHRDAQVN